MRDKAEGDSGISAPKHTIPKKLELEENVMSEYKVDGTKIHTYGVHVVVKVSGMREGVELRNRSPFIWRRTITITTLYVVQQRVDNRYAVEPCADLVVANELACHLETASQQDVQKDRSKKREGRGEDIDILHTPSSWVACWTSVFATELTTFLARYRPVAPVAIARNSPTENTSCLPAALIPGVLRVPFNLWEVKPDYPCVCRLMGTPAVKKKLGQAAGVMNSEYTPKLSVYRADSTLALPAPVKHGVLGGAGAAVLAGPLAEPILGDIRYRRSGTSSRRNRTRDEVV
ncbi:hypothetical protein B0H14DRAFT_3735527 [Mycena olivaceomarginata]|nr:hypothetical protein B0H14DRAFT_3735527 [Mycena olivaceomarginata]